MDGRDISAFTHFRRRAMPGHYEALFRYLLMTLSIVMAGLVPAIHVLLSVKLYVSYRSFQSGFIE